MFSPKLRRLNAGLFLLIALLGFEGHCGVNHDPNLTWQTLHSDHFRIHYHDGLETLATDVAAIAEATHDNLSRYFNWRPKQQTDVVLNDEIDLANGSATPLPTNRMVLFVTPPDEGLFDYAAWLETLIVHEYVHVLHLDMATRLPNAMRAGLGRHPLLFPNLYQPMWFIEGLATYIESDSERGIGRGQSSYFDMLMRMEVAAGVKPLRQINQTIATWPAGTTPYLYGAQFHAFLAARYGDEAIKKWFTEFADNLIPFRINGNSKAVVGKNLTMLWQEFNHYLDEKYTPQLRAIEAQGLHQGTRLTHHGYRGGQSQVGADGRVYYIRDDGRSNTALMVWHPDEPQPRHLVDLNGEARFDVHPDAGIVIAQPELYRNANFYYDLYHFDLESRHLRRLTTAQRYRFATWNTTGTRIAAVAQSRGNQRLVLLDRDGQLGETLWQGTQGEILSHLDWSPDQQHLLTSRWQPQGGWNLAEFSLQQRQWRPLTADAAIQLQPHYSPDGAGILFSADYDGIYNIHYLHRSDGRIQTLSRVLAGAFHPSLNDSGTLFYTGYSAEGYDLYRLTPAQQRKDEMLEPATVASSGAYRPTPQQAGTLSRSSYAPAGGLRPAWWTPLFAVDDDMLLAGMATNGADPLLRHSYTAAVGYELKNDELVGGVDYLYDGWYPIVNLHASRDLEFHRFSSGDLSRIRRSDFVRASLSFPFWSYHQRWALHAGLMTEITSDAYVRPGVARAADETEHLAGLALTFNSARRHPLSISQSHGRNVSLVAEESGLGNSRYDGQVYSLDWREFLALGREHVLSVRAVGGVGSDTPRPYRLGGNDSAAALFGTAAPFDRRDYALRGYPEGLAILSGRRMQLFSGEWRFPIRRIERGFMVPPIGIDQLSGALFVDSGATWHKGSGPDNYYTGIGAELNANVRLFYHLPLRLRLGYAHGMDEFGEDQTYIQLGTAF